MTKIGHSSINEKGTVKGGKKGDQTGKEVCIRDWYLHKKGWVVIRPINPEDAEIISSTMEKICANDCFGYGQDYRDSGFNELKKVNFDPEKVKVKCGLDCSKTVMACCWAAGIKVDNFVTKTQIKTLEKTGKFEILTSDKYCKSSDYLKRGDILVTAKVPGHTVVNLTNGAKVGKTVDMKLIALDAGHGMKTAGKRTPNGDHEWELNDKVRDYVVDYLKGYNCEFIFPDGNEGNTDESLSSRRNKYVNAKVDAAVSIHHNANTGRWNNATGVETYTDKNYTSADDKLAKCVQKRLAKYTGLKDRGVKRANWSVIYQNKVAAILTEGGFMDGVNDYKIIMSTDGQKAYARAVAEGLIEFLGLKKISSASSSASSSTTSNKTSNISNSKIDTIQEVQKWLNNNYDAGLTVDKVYGSKTKKALVKALQTELNETYKPKTKLIVDGIFGSKTKAVIKTLKPGTKGDLVKVLQALLICHGYTSAYLDGDYGKATSSAVKEYKKKKKFSLVNSNAGKAMFESLCK